MLRSLSSINQREPTKTSTANQVTSAEHRAGWDATFSAPKSVSLTALVGGDERVREAHRESVRVALHELERYTQARIGNVHSPETTGKFIAATFEHDTARPVDGYAAPQLHTHAVIFNITERENGQARALQERSLFQSQQYATSVYRSELAMQLPTVELRRSSRRFQHGQPEVKGCTQKCLEACGLGRAQIQGTSARDWPRGCGSCTGRSASCPRDSENLLSREEVLERATDLAAKFGYQPDQVVAKARVHIQKSELQPEKTAQQSLTYSRNHVFERSAVQDERSILRAAMDQSMGEATLLIQLQQEFEQHETWRVSLGRADGW